MGLEKFDPAMAAYIGRPPVGRMNDAKVSAESVLNKGMITAIDSADLPPGAVTVAKNVRVRYDKTSRRLPYIDLIAADPDSETVLALIDFRNYVGTRFALRFVSDKVYLRNVNSWALLTGTINACTRYSVAVYKDTIVFSNDGENVIQQINTALTSYAALGNAPRYKFLTVFGNRVVGAYRVDTTDNPIEVGWSGDGNITEWDAAVDESAGNGPVVDSPGDYSDFITNIFGFTNVLILLRERSVWEATKTSIPSFPFSFAARYAGMGCDCSRSAVVVANGVIWMDVRTRSVYIYEPGGNGPVNIAKAIEDQLFDSFVDRLRVFAAYDPNYKEYQVYVNDKLWIFNLTTQAWTYDDLMNVSCGGFFEDVGALFGYDDLPGTFDSLVGTYDDLAETSIEPGGVVLGFENGNVMKPGEVEDVETFSAEVVSKTYELPDDDIIVNSFSFIVDVNSPASLRLEYSKNDGSWVRLKTFVLNTGDAQIMRCRKGIRARRLKWRLVSEFGSWDLLKYAMRVYPASMSSK